MSESGIAPEERRGIYENLRRYAWCLDHADGGGVASTFTRDGVVETTAGASFHNPGGVADFVAQAATMVGFAGRQHHMQPMLIEKTDDGYFVQSYWMVLTMHAGSAPFMVSMGYYRDTCVLEDGQWRFKKKIIARWDKESAPIYSYSG
jgi:hypothetical protein